MARAQFQNRRKNYFINKKFQTEFILKFCMLVIFAAVISAVIIYHFSSQSVTTVFENSRLAIKPSTEFIMPGLILSSLISVALIGIATSIVVLFVSHRIAGPLYKLESSLERMGSGDISFDIHFRARDETRRLAEVFNATSRGLNGFIGDVKAESAHLNSAIDELRDLVEKTPKEQHAELMDIVKKITVINNRLNVGLNRFRLR